MYVSDLAYFPSSERWKSTEKEKEYKKAREILILHLEYKIP